MKFHIIIGTRGSKLALKQSEIVQQKLLQQYPDLQIEIKIIATQGDTNSSPIPLDTIGKGWFTKEIEAELLGGNIDMAVHSLKDLPEVLPPGLTVASYPEREDARDVLVSKNNLQFKDLPKGAVVGTDSLRRKVQLLNIRPDLNVTSIRGNVPTRLQKMRDENYHAIVIAAAGLIRLRLAEQITQYFEMDEITPAPGQGILAVEVRQDDAKVIEIVTAINNKSAEASARAEREFSFLVGGGCKEPVGAYATYADDKLELLGMAGTLDGKNIIRQSISGNIAKWPEISKQLAEQILTSLNAKK